MPKITQPFVQNVEPPKTLAQILKTLEEADNALLDLSPDDMRQLGSMLAEKVDAYHTVLSKMAAEEKRLREEAESFLKPARALASAQERLKQSMSFVMMENKYLRIPGDKYRVELKESKSVSCPLDPTKDDQWVYPDFVRVKFEWDKKALREALEGDDKEKKALAEKVAEVVTNVSPVFKPNRKEIE